MKHSILLFLFGLAPSLLFAQSTLDISGHNDCENLLTITTKRTVGPTTAPEGFGEKREFSNNPKQSIHFMENENNSVWYAFSSKMAGEFTFEIEPLDSLDDYDFALYEYTDKNFCADVIAQKIKPIRTNFSRNKPTLQSKTGLDLKGKAPFVGAGVNPAYSQAVRTKPKKKYVLLVNNVYANGQGHLLHFNYSMQLELEGQVEDKDGNTALQANVKLTNAKTGKVLAETLSDSTTGSYKLTFDIPTTQIKDPLHLSVSKDGYFFKDTMLTAYKIMTKMRKVKLKSPIKKLKKGDSHVVNNILFHGDSPKPLPRAMPSIKALFKTMKRNKGLKIQIEGHTNGCSKGQDFSMQLSHARAKTVYEFLLSKNIAADRISYKGYGCERMLHDMRGHLAYLNRRVEIKIIDL